MTQYRVGNGIDVHRFGGEPAEGSCVTLGGVAIAHDRRLLAHSDGDVLTHALMDAMLGALALGDIGRHFPDTDPAYRGISSLALLGKVQAMIHAAGWTLGNADITVVAQAPKISPHAGAISGALAGVLGVAADCISVKATTSEGLGFTGRQEGIAVFATVLLVKD